MNQAAYKVNHKVKPPSIPDAPTRHPYISFALTTGVIISALFFAVGLLTLTLNVLALGLLLGGITYGAHLYRKHYHETDLEKYRQRVERTWISSDSFIKTRDFFILLGFKPDTAYTIAESVGTDTLANKTYSEVKGYYPLTSVLGDKAISAVSVESILSPKGNLKLTTTILQGA